MSGIGRSIGAVVAGAVVWAVLWIGGTLAAQAAFPELLAAGQRVEHAGALLSYIGYSMVLSVLAGYTTGRLADAQAVAWLAGLQLVLGIGFEASAWQLTPVWYHVVFLALIVPATLYGGAVARRGAGVQAVAHRQPQTG